MTIHIPENFYKETIAQDWPTGTGNFYVSTKPTKTFGRLVISPSSSTLREIVRYTAVGTDGTGDYVTVAERGIGGTTEQTHVVGETVRNNVTAETIQEISDAIDQVVSQGAQDATVEIKGIAKLPRIEITTGTTHSLTTVAGETVIVWACGVNNTSNWSNQTVSLKYNGVAKHTITHDETDNEGKTPFSLMYSEIPGAATANITIESSKNLVSTDCKIIVLKI